jgi:Zn-dependent M28 family amino/carboxypeptidase
MKGTIIAHAAALVGAALVICGVANPAFAEDRFDGDKAFAHVKALVDIGPRPADTPGAVKAQEYIAGRLMRLGLDVREQEFIANTPLGSKRMKNIIAVIPGKRREIIIIGAHYDTKLFKDVRFVGANDGGSGTGVLLELARYISAQENEMTIWLAFFDGEEAFVRWSGMDSLYGSRHMASMLYRLGDLNSVKAMILLDMVGDRDLSIEWESHSTSWLKKVIWESARKLKYRDEFTSNTRKIADDHLPFLNYGIPSVDIIDFHYGPESLTNEYWHTPQDTLDKISPASLQIVGDVIIHALPGIIKEIDAEDAILNPLR